MTSTSKSIVYWIFNALIYFPLYYWLKISILFCLSKYIYIFIFYSRNRNSTFELFELL